MTHPTFGDTPGLLYNLVMSTDGSVNNHASQPLRKPSWLRRKIHAGQNIADVQHLLAELELCTVCSSAMCPNISECFARRTATFMIMGDACTRDCRFCAVSSTEPQPLRDDEPQAVAEATARLGLRHVVITSVTRDDLPDGGAGHFARTIAAVRKKLPETRIEVLTPDFRGDRNAINCVIEARPDVFNHNVETVPRLYSQVRPQADYRQSLAVLAHARDKAGELGPSVCTKSGLMVGLGETEDEVLDVMRDLRAVGCEILTVGQYLAPSRKHFPVAKYVAPEQFKSYEIAGEEMGFSAVAAGPFVRSSYQAEQVFNDSRSGKTGRIG